MMIRFFAAPALIITLAFGLTACATPDIANQPKRDLGDLGFGHNIVVAPEIMKGPLSREASAEDWIESVKTEVGTRMGRYDGDRLVHLGINVGGYVLAHPGIPIVGSPKSALVLLVTAWDDEAGAKFHEKPFQVVVTESFSAKGFIGSGLTTTAEEQMANLTTNGVAAIEVWLSQHADCMRDDTRGADAVACWTRVDKELKEAEKDVQ